MSRAYGKRTPRGGSIDDLLSVPHQDGNEGGVQAGELANEKVLPDPRRGRGEGEQEGIGAPDQGRGWYRGIPGGQNHIGNPPVQRQPGYSKPVEYPFSNAILAHGVEPEGNMSERDPRLQGVTSQAHTRFKGEAPGPDPVPVYIVEQGGGRDPLADTGTRRLTLPAAGSEPVQIVSEDPGRSLIQLLNEDSTHHARIGKLGDLTFDVQNSVITGGARLPANATSYMIMRTQGPLWAVSETSNTVSISVVTEFQIANAG